MLVTGFFAQCVTMQMIGTHCPPWLYNLTVYWQRRRIWLDLSDMEWILLELNVIVTSDEIHSFCYEVRTVLVTEFKSVRFKLGLNINQFSFPRSLFIFLIQVRLRTEVPSTPSSTWSGFELMTSRPLQYISCHWGEYKARSVLSLAWGPLTQATRTQHRCIILFWVWMISGFKICPSVFGMKPLQEGQLTVNRKRGVTNHHVLVLMRIYYKSHRRIDGILHVFPQDIWEIIQYAWNSQGMYAVKQNMYVHI